jgi:hypothetical protein
MKMSLTKQIKVGSKMELAQIKKRPEELALGYLRYEALRKLNAGDFLALKFMEELGKNFDEMVDELIAK